MSTTTRYTYDGSPVTGSSLEVTGKLTLTHDVTLRARCYSAANYRSSETVAVFDSLIPEVPAESYVSPAYMEIVHATLDGSPAQVSVDGPSGTMTGISVGASRYLVRYPLSATEPTALTLHRNGVADVAGSVVWQAIDIADYAAIHEITIRCGESLLLTAGSGQTNVVITIADASGADYRSPITSLPLSCSIKPESSRRRPRWMAFPLAALSSPWRRWTSRVRSPARSGIAAKSPSS